MSASQNQHAEENRQGGGGGGGGGNKQRTNSSSSEPAYNTRPTIADHVRNNMIMLNRNTFYQRIIFFGRHRQFKKGYVDSRQLKKIYEDVTSKCKDNFLGEKLTGLFLLYEDYTIVLLEGSEEVLRIFFQHFAPIATKFYIVAKVLLSMSNVNQLFFDRIIWRVSIPPSQVADLAGVDTAEMSEILNTSLRKIYKLCERLEKLIDKNDTANPLERIPTEGYSDHLPVRYRMSLIIDSSETISLQEYITMTQSVPAQESYLDNVWPIPFDYVPRGISKKLLAELQFSNNSPKRKSSNTE